MNKKALPTPPFYKPYKLKSVLNKIHLIKKKRAGLVRLFREERSHQGWQP